MGGLARYDGYGVQFFTKEPGGLSSNGIHTVIEDADGILWIGTDDGGLNKYDKTTDAALWTTEPVACDLQPRGGLINLIRRRKPSPITSTIPSRANSKSTTAHLTKAG